MMNNFNNQIQQANHIIFIRRSQNSVDRTGFNTINSFGFAAKKKQFSFNKNGFQTFNLIQKLDYNQLFQKMPKQFTLTTNNGSCNFNIELLSKTSSVISNFLKENPQNFQYHLDIDDEDNVLSKFKQMYEGENVTFDEEELPVSQKITKMLNLTCFPNFLKPESLKAIENNQFGYVPNQTLSAELSRDEFSVYLKQYAPQTFTIITNTQKYECNIFGVLSSSILSEVIQKDATATSYTFDFSDEFGEFQAICDFFNFKDVSLNVNNMHAIKEIAEDLQISCIIEGVEKYINERENLFKMIDEQEEIVETVDDLFDLLYNIRTKTVQTVKETIIKSNWAQTEDKVHELAAFIIQVIRTDFLLHPYIIDLLAQIDKKAEKSSKLKNLLPFVTSMMVYSTFKSLQKPVNNSNKRGGWGYQTTSYQSTNNTMTLKNKMINYGFVYGLLKNGMIQKEDIKKYLANYDLNDMELNMWFLPELIEIHTLEKIEKQIKKIPGMTQKFGNMYEKDKNTSNDAKSFLSSFLPDKIDEYKEMRDKGEPTDAITKALREDDVDTLQSIVSKNQVDFLSTFVPFNMFENYIDNGRTRYINYAAAYGSLKCFKYLLLNHDNIDNYTFPYAVFGGNIEIIKITDQRSEEIGNIPNFNRPYNNINDNQQFSRISPDDKLVPAIMKHQNDLFDWILEQNNFDKNKNRNMFASYLKCSVENGNAHSLFEIIEKGFNFATDQAILNENCICAAQNGFYMIAQLLSSFTTNKEVDFSISPQSTVYFGNISIFNLFMKYMSQEQLFEALKFAVKRGYENIIKYFFDTLIKKEFHFNENLSFDILKESIDNPMFDYLFEKIKELDPSFFNDASKISLLLTHACKSTKNVNVIKILTDLILAKDTNYNFTSYFLDAVINEAVDICKYFIDKKVLIEYESLSANIKEIASINDELFVLITQNISPETQELFFGCLDQAIENKNKKLVDFLLQKGAFSNNVLKLAVKTNDLELVNIVLKYNSKPSFINRAFKEGTALTIAATNNNVQIVQRLLTLPEIDPCLFGFVNVNPLIEAVKERNIKIFDAILDFCGEKISQQKWIINEIIQIFVDSQVQNTNNNNQPFNYGMRYQNLPPQPVQKKDDDGKTRDHILSRLLGLKGIDINYHYKQQTLLTYACSISNFTLVGSILGYDDIDVNMPESINGDTPLIVAAKEGNYDIVKLLIDHPQININAHNFEQETALTIAVQKEQNNIIDLIISNEKFDPKESRLDYAFVNSRGETAEYLLSIESLDVNYICFSDEYKATLQTPLINAVNNGDLNMVNLIINHPSFDRNKSQMKRALKDAICNDEKDIFIVLSKGIGKDINTFQLERRNLLDFASINASQNILPEILQNPNFSSKESDIFQAFVDSYTVPPLHKPKHPQQQQQQNNFMGNHPNNFMGNHPNNFMGNHPNNFMGNQQNNFMGNHPNNFMGNNFNNMNLNNDNDDQDKSPVSVMEILYKFDQEHDHLIDLGSLLPSGKSFFTSIVIAKHASDVASFLLSHGADPNKPDSRGVLPLEYALRMISSELALALIDSGKVDFAQKVAIEDHSGLTTFLHVAARFSRPDVVEEIVTRKLVDINEVDDLGDTPLIAACKAGKEENVAALFECDFCGGSQIDFLHRNKNGEDAIKIVDPWGNSEEISDKEQYLVKLMRLMSKTGDDEENLSDDEI